MFLKVVWFKLINYKDACGHSCLLFTYTRGLHPQTSSVVHRSLINCRARCLLNWHVGCLLAYTSNYTKVPVLATCLETCGPSDPPSTDACAGLCIVDCMENAGGDLNTIGECTSILSAWSDGTDVAVSGNNRFFSVTERVSPFSSYTFIYQASFLVVDCWYCSILYSPFQSY